MISDSNTKKDQLPDLHDWEILGVRIDRFSRIAEITLHFPDEGRNAILRFYEVKKFFLSEMRIQNVILDMLLFDARSESDYFIRSCQLLGINPPDFDQQSGQKVLYIEPSVGVEMACCFSHFEYIEK